MPTIPAEIYDEKLAEVYIIQVIKNFLKHSLFFI